MAFICVASASFSIGQTVTICWDRGALTSVKCSNPATYASQIISCRGLSSRVALAVNATIPYAFTSRGGYCPGPANIRDGSTDATLLAGETKKSVPRTATPENSAIAAPVKANAFCDSIPTTTLSWCLVTRLTTMWYIVEPTTKPTTP